jgi:hypothetical protein
MFICLYAYGIYKHLKYRAYGKEWAMPADKILTVHAEIQIDGRGTPAQRFISAHPAGYQLFNLERYSVSTDNYLYFRRASLRPEKYNGDVKLM